MSNLSELLPAGAGAKSASFVASGTLGSGVTVALKSDGTVEVVAAVSQTIGTPVTIKSSETYTILAAYDTASGKVVIVYQDPSVSYYGVAVVGTVSGPSISFGTAVAFSNVSLSGMRVVYDSSSGKMVFTYNAFNASGRAKVGTVSGTSISFGSESYWGSYVRTQNSTYDTVTNKVILFWPEFGLTNYPMQASVGTVSGTTVSFATPVSVGMDRTYSAFSPVFDENANKVVLYYSGSVNPSEARVGTVSGTSISFSSAVQFKSGDSGSPTSVYDANAQKTIVVYQDSTNSSYITAQVGTISGGSISFGSATVLISSGLPLPYSAVYDSGAGKSVFCLYDNGSPYYGTLVFGTVSGTTFSAGTPVTFGTGGCAYTGSAYDSANKKVVIGYSDLYNSPYNTDAVVFQNAGSNSVDFIGITDQAIANTATGAVIVQGGVSEKVTGLTTGSDYYVQGDGTLSTTVSSVPAGRALSSTSILLEG